MTLPSEIRQNAQNLLDFIDSSPSPWHACETLENALSARGFERIDETARWTLKPGGQYYVIRGGSSLIAFIVGSQALTESGFRIVGAHTDSPGLRLKPHSAHAAAPMTRLGVEVYGGPILASFTDRDLSLAGRLCIKSGTQVGSRLIRFDQPLVRLPNLAIHMNRSVNEDGLKLNKQSELPLLLGNWVESLPPENQLTDLLAKQSGVDAAEILSFDLNVYDTQKGSFWGAEQEFIANSQLDNLASCHAGLTGLLQIEAPKATCIAGFFDHEEIGSETAQGAGGSFLTDLTERIAHVLCLDSQGYKQALAQSFFISTDMAHAYQPNFPSSYEPQHLIKVNAGPVIKTNASQRYATNSFSEAQFMRLCESAEVPFQRYAHRTDLGCGSTIGPMLSARLGVQCVDVGNPMWAMHSLRESAGVYDGFYLQKVLAVFFNEK